MERKPGSAMDRSFAKSSLSMMGDKILIIRQLSGTGFNRFCSGPRAVLIDVTSSSRMASRGGFVTCANSCLK